MLAIVALFMGCVYSPGTAASEPIRVAYLPAVQSLPLFVAVEEGFFEEEDLVVELERIESPNQIIDALISGNVDAGAPSVAAGIVGIVETKNPGALKSYSLTCGTIGVLNDELVVAERSTISSIQDLKGKRLGHLPGVQFSTMAKKILLENNVSPNEVIFVELPMPNQLPSLSSGAVDAVLTLEPIGTIGNQKGTARVLVANPMVRFVADPWCGGAGVVSAHFINERPEEAQRFVKVMRKAIEKTNQDPEMRSYLVQYLNLPESIAVEVPLPLIISSQDLDEKTINAYQQFVDTFFELEVIDQKPDVRDILLEHTEE
ncbi:ABC transporter substrate-binding protein [Candidatus Micrarchaeota archaeon]|nr:ABC transporter substrate-binding protein [Candidatus Micrarchaeota archaeon]